MRLSLTTPILRTVVRKLVDFDNKAAETIVKVDNYIKSNRILSAVFSNETEDDLRLVRPMLNEKLIQLTIKDCVERERMLAQLPKPGGDWQNMAAIEDSLKKHNEKVVKEKAKEQASKLSHFESAPLDKLIKDLTSKT